MKDIVAFNGVTYNSRHGGPFDRGSADSYYGRLKNPHYFAGATYSSEEFREKEMTEEQIDAYRAGYEWNERFGDKKNWD